MRLGIALDLGSSGPLAPQLERAKHLARAAEEAGFASLWLGESYHQRPAPFHLPAPLITLTHLATLTSLDLGTGVLLLRAYNVRKLAYEAALVDNLTGGRLTLGVGLGDTWVSKSLEGERLQPTFFDSGLVSLKESWSGCSDRGIAPSPRQPGGPRLLVGGQGSRAVKRAIDMGDGYFAATHYSDDLLRARALQYREGGGQGDLCVTRICVVRDDPAEARRIAQAYFAAVRNFYVGLGVWGLAADGTTDAALGVMLAGTPDEIESHIKEYESWGVNQLNLRVAPIEMPTNEAKETLRVVGRLFQH